MFYDINLPLGGYHKDIVVDHFRYQASDYNEAEVIEEISQHLAAVYKEATLISLEEHGVDPQSELVGFGWMHTLRNRPLRDHGFKISIRLITILMLPLHVCAAVAAHVKREVLRSNIALMGLSEDVADLLVGSIDETQYRRHGSLSLPFDTMKTAAGEFTSWIFCDYAIAGQHYAIMADNHIAMSSVNINEYQLNAKANYVSGNDASPEFVIAALEYVHEIPDYSDRVWNINASAIKGCTMFVKRYAPSMCSACHRMHDHDNTLFLIFNSDLGVAFSKCARNPDMRAPLFYHRYPGLNAIGRRP